MSIGACNFSLKPLNSDCYELNVHFFKSPEETKAPVSKKQFVFEQHAQPVQSEFLDIYSQNGTCPDKVHDLFTKNKGALFKADDLKGIDSVANKWVEEQAAQPSVFVLDLKDQKGAYADKSTIGQYETAFCHFLQNGPTQDMSKRAKDIHHLFQEKLPVDFVLCEGSLKCDLLKSFSPEQQEYFVHTKQGKKDLCQYGEFYMNGFKLGQETKQVSAAPYFLAPNSQTGDFQPSEKSTVWYPSNYQDMYAIDSPFYKGMSPVFDVTGGIHPDTQITNITVKKKEKL